jgi:murein DD-endopeptidase MepM/ murein hydrolase activator NlpD
MIAPGPRVLLFPLGVAVALVLLGPARPITATGPAALLPPLTPPAPITQPFGCTPFPAEPPAPWCPSGHVHTGVDLAAATGTPVHAAAAGIAEVVASASGYGIHVLLHHDPALLTLYGHLSAVAVRSGDAIAPGQVIGWVGSTGLSTGPHLHFEVRRDGRPADPLPMLPAGTYE